MRLILCLSFIMISTSGCATIMGWFKRHDAVVAPEPPAPVQKEKPQRVTRKSLEEEAMLGEDSGSLWVSRGQASYLFTNNNLRLIGDVLNIRLEGYPKEQITTKANVISKLLAEILNEQRQEIKIKQDELKKQMDPANQPPKKNFIQRTLSSEEEKPPGPDPAVELKNSERDLASVEKEDIAVKNFQKQREFPITTVLARITEVQKDGNYKVKADTPFMIGKREYNLLIMGTVRAEEYEEKGVSAEILVDPTFDIISVKKSGEL